MTNDDSGASSPVVIWANVPITRRKSFYVITGAGGVVIYRNRHLWPCVQFLDLMGVKEYEIRPSEAIKRQRVPFLRVKVE